MTEMKYGVTPTSPNQPVWYTPSHMFVNGNTVTYDITNNWLGDDTFTGPDGIINDPIVPMSPAATTSIPILTEWGMMALAGLLGLFGLVQLSRRRVMAA